MWILGLKGLKKTICHDGLTLESGIWSCDTGQWIPCFQSCQPQHGCETIIYQVAGSYSS